MDCHPTDQYSAVNTASSTATDLSTSSRKRPLPQGILKGSSENHTIASVPSEGPPQKKRIHWGYSFLNNISTQPQEVDIERVSPSDSTIAEPEVVFASKKVEKWATNLAKQKEIECQDIKDALSYIEKNPTALSLESQEQLKGYHAIIRDQVHKAKKYVLWANYRTALLKGRKDAQEALDERGHIMSKAWTLEEIHHDWELLKDDPWTQELPQYDELKQIIAPLISEHRQSQKREEEAKATMASLPEDVQEDKKDSTNSTNQQGHLNTSGSALTHEDNSDMVFVPGYGTVNRRAYNVDRVENHPDGGYIIVDMTGRRYHWNPPTAPSNC